MIYFGAQCPLKLPKPWPQKATGEARKETYSRNNWPQWEDQNVAFTASPGDCR